MDAEQKLKIRSTCSQGDVENAIGCLNDDFVSTSQRQGIVKLLKLCQCGISDNDRDGLLYTFEKSMYAIPRIPENKREMTRQLLISLRDAFKEEESDQYLLDHSACLGKDIGKITKALIFHRCFSSNRTFKHELRELLREAITNQISDIRKEITLLGEASEGDFWEDLEKKYPTDASNLPSFMEFKSITTYHGNCPEPWGQLE